MSLGLARLKARSDVMQHTFNRLAITVTIYRNAVFDAPNYGEVLGYVVADSILGATVDCTDMLDVHIAVATFLGHNDFNKEFLFHFGKWWDNIQKRFEAFQE